MIYRRLNKLKKYKQDLYSCMLAAYQSGADPEIIAIKVSDLEHDLTEIDEEIKFEEIMISYKWVLTVFVAYAIVLLFTALIKTYLL
jgi:hypothetical protein